MTTTVTTIVTTNGIIMEDVAASDMVVTKIFEFHIDEVDGVPWHYTMLKSGWNGRASMVQL